MVGWDPRQYERFAGPRLRPALDLLGRLPERSFHRIWDLGCGGGQVTRLLAERFPDAAITGLDTAPAMLEQARAAVPSARFRLADIGRERPPPGADLVVSNAALQWLPDHQRLLGELADDLAPGGVIAVQMPGNHDAPSHRIIAETAAMAAFAPRLAAVQGIGPVADAGHYAALLLDRGCQVDAWETRYVHVLGGADPVLNWLLGTTLRPYLDALGAAAPEFLDALRRRIAAAYPCRPDGTCLFPFRRVFCIAVRLA